MLNFFLSFFLGVQHLYNLVKLWTGLQGKLVSFKRQRACETGHDYFAESPLFFSSKRDKGKYLRTNSDGNKAIIELRGTFVSGGNAVIFTHLPLSVKPFLFFFFPFWTAKLII